MARKKDEDQANQSGKAHGKYTNDGDEPNFSDPEGFVDDVSDDVLLADILKRKPRETDGVESVIVIDNAPIVEPERLPRLQSAIKKIFSQFGTIVNEFHPVDEKGHTKGYVFLEFSTPEHALEAVKTTNNYKLDRNYTLKVNLFTDINKYDEIPDEWEPPKAQPYKNEGDIYSYLLDADAYDQFIICCENGSSVQVWQNSLPEPTKLDERVNWTKSYVKWSPLGTYMVAFYQQGLALWAGPSGPKQEFVRFMKFLQPGVEFVDFSPCEKYLVAYSPHIDHQHTGQFPLVIWDIRTGLEKRSFLTEGPVVWPVLRWSHDDKYFARLIGDKLSVYETPGFGLLDNKSIKVPGMRDFSWSPTDNILAYWVAENKDVPARVTLLELPQRTEIRNKNLFSVGDCKIHWQKSGDYLCVKVDRYTKMRAEKSERKYIGLYYNFEIFHMREKDFPVDSVEIKEPIHAFAWEPIGTKFAIIHGETANICVSFYDLHVGQAPTLLKKLQRKACNHLFWSPNGQFIVLAGLVTMNGALEFVDTNDFTIMNTTDHYEMSDIEWDPTGRYVVTAVSKWKAKHDYGYWMWSFQGKILKRVNVPDFVQFLWRPRPPTLLTAEQQKEIKKSLKKYQAQFESKDRLRLTKASKELVAKRAALMKEFETYRQQRLEQWRKSKPKRMQLRKNIDTDELDSDTKNVGEEVVEFFIKEETIVMD